MLRVSSYRLRIKLYEKDLSLSRVSSRTTARTMMSLFQLRLSPSWRRAIQNMASLAEEVPL